MSASLLVLAVTLFPGSWGYVSLGAYMPVSNVLEHAQVTLDVAALNAKLKGDKPDFAGATSIYRDGMHSCKSPTKRRTLQGFARKDLAGESFYDSFSAAGFVAPSYWDSWMLDAFNGRGLFQGLSDTKRVTCLKKGVLGILTLYTSHELEAAIVKAQDPAKRGHSGGGTAAHAWDEGWAFYHGVDGKASPWEVAKKRDDDFPTGMAVATTIVGHFNQGLTAVRNGTYDNLIALLSRDSLYKQWAITYLRGALKYLEIAEFSYQEQAHAEGHAYFKAIDGWVSAKSPATAQALRSALDIQASAVPAGTFCQTKKLLEASYPSLGLDCDLMGSWKGSKISCEACASPVATSLPSGSVAAVAVEGLASDVQCSAPSEGAIAAATVSQAPIVRVTPMPSAVLAETQVMTCSFGCWDREDEACHDGLDQNKCAEIYGHVKWVQKCRCQALEGSQPAPSASAAAATGGKIYFSVPAFVVLFRESLEVTILLVIMLQFLQKACDEGSIDEKMLRSFRREVWLGTSMGGLVALVLGVAVLILASLLYNVFEGHGELIFEGVVTLLASAILTYLALSFYKLIINKEKHEKELGEKIEKIKDALKSQPSQTGSSSLQAFTSIRQRSFFVLAFTTGLREGMESIVFLVSVVPDLKDLWSLPLPIVCALLLSRLLGFCFFKSTHQLALGRFMKVCSAFLMFIAAGLFMSSTHKFQELAVFGTWSPRSDRPWGNSELWNWSAAANDKSNRFFVLMRALFGYQDRPTPVELMAYGLYWVIGLLLVLIVVVRDGKTATPEPTGGTSEAKEPRDSESTTASRSKSESEISL